MARGKLGHTQGQAEVDQVPYPPDQWPPAGFVEALARAAVRRSRGGAPGATDVAEGGERGGDLQTDIASNFTGINSLTHG